MEIKAWSYEEFPDFTEPVEGARVLHASGDDLAVTYVHDVVYAQVDGVDLHLQILIPESRNVVREVPQELEIVDSYKLLPPTGVRGGALPCFVYVQGSAWRQQDVYQGVARLSRLALQGYVVAIVEYRHSGIASFPAQIIDARNAVRFLRTQADTYFVDPERIVLGGSSSGGHTAVFAGFRHNDNTPENLYPGVSGEVSGIIDLFGAVSIMDEDGEPTMDNHHLPDSPEGAVLGGVNLREHPELCRAFSAECCITPDTVLPPVLLIHGTKDRTVNVRQSVRLYRRLRECGKPADLVLLQGADHGGSDFWSPQMVEVMDEFIKQCFSGKEDRS